MDLEAQPFPLRECVASAVQQVRAEAQKKNVKIAEVVHARVPERVRGDMRRVQQALPELVSNAVKLTPPGGQVAILVTSHITGDHHEIKFDVSHSGTGLGRGSSSSFSFEVAVEATAAAANAGTPQDLSGEQPLRILVADDNPVNQIVIRLLLARLGYEADFVADGQDAVSAVKRQPYDVVFLDVRMPVLDGLAAAREVCRLFPANRRPRLVGLAARAHADDRRDAQVAGMDDCLETPLTVDSVVAVLRRVVHVDALHDPALKA